MEGLVEKLEGPVMVGKELCSGGVVEVRLWNYKVVAMPLENISRRRCQEDTK